MNTAKVLEVIAEGKTIEDALQNAVSDASKTIRGIKSIYADSFNAKVEDGKIKHYRVNAKITFVLD
ncbi:MAG: dodecin family protein [Luteolibacter sp.]